MPEDILPSITKRLESICRRASADADEQVQRELMGHLHDKLLAYLNGQEKLTQEDALLLVERHFGNAAILRRQLLAVHKSSPTAALKRLSVPLVISSSARLVVSLAFIVVMFVENRVWDGLWHLVFVDQWFFSVAIFGIFPLSAAALIFGLWLGRKTRPLAPVLGWGGAVIAVALYLLSRWFIASYFSDICVDWLKFWWVPEAVLWMWYTDEGRGRLWPVLATFGVWVIFITASAMLGTLHVFFPFTSFDAWFFPFSYYEPIWYSGLPILFYVVSTWLIHWRWPTPANTAASVILP